MAKLEEQDILAPSTLSPEQIKKQSTLFANVANAQSAVDVAQANVNKNPKSAVYQSQLDTAKSVLEIAKSTYDFTKTSEAPKGKTVANQFYKGTGKSRVLHIVYSDGTEQDVAAPDNTEDQAASAAAAEAARAAAFAKQQAEAAARAGRQSAYDLLAQQFKQYGLEALITPLKGLIEENISPSEFAIRLESTDAYKKRFAANQERIKSGLRALSPAEYIGLEDQYQSIMRQYGLPSSYYTKGDLGIQEGFNKLLAGDVSAAELEDRIATAQSRVINANPQVKTALKQFYPDITDGDILAYSLDPQKALTDIKRKVTAAEIGSAAMGQGLATSATEAEKLASYGVTKQQATQGYQAIAEFLPTGQKLSQIYGETPYTQQQAEQEIFNLADAAEAAKKRKRLTQLEQASFAGSSGISGGALSRDRAVGGQGAYGAGQY